MPVPRSHHTTGPTRPVPARSRLLVVVAALALALTAVGGAVTPAAAVTPTAGAAPATAQRGHAAPARPSLAPTTAPTRHGTQPLTTTRSVPHATGRPAAPSPTTPPVPATGPTSRARTVQPAGVGQSCSGTLAPHTVTDCGQPASTDSYTVTAAATPDVLVVRAQPTGGGYLLPITVLAPDGTTLTCDTTSAVVVPTTCTLAQSGTYTVQVSAPSTPYTVAADLLLSDSTCPLLSTSFAAVSTTTSVTAGDVGTCYRTSVPSGDVVRATVYSSTVFTSLMAYDATGSRVCFVHSDTCSLTGAAPYRWLVVPVQAGADTATLRVDDLTHPQGCQQVPVQHFSATPTSSPGDCKTFTVATTGRYVVGGASTAGSVGGAVYDASGHPACSNQGFGCQLDPGTYALVTDLGADLATPWALTFVAAADTTGCNATSDTGFADGAATGTIGAPGGTRCLSLPTATGKSLYVFDQVPASPTARPALVGSSFTLPVALLDATGTPQCPDANLVQAVCPLTGTAPYRLVVVNQDATSSYQLLLQRTDSQAGCPVLAATGFSPAYGASVTLDPSHDAGCLSIPAGQHSTGEMLDFTDQTGTLNAAMGVYDPSGNQVCISYFSSLETCSFTRGVAYTVLPVAPRLDGPDTYHVVRRDVSATASCSAPASTTVGGPSTVALLTSTIDARCLRVTGSTSDQVWAGVRARGVGGTGAVRFVTDTSGTQVCGTSVIPSCQVTGATTYQVVVVASGYGGVPIPAHVDVWRVGTSSGWAPECAAHRMSGDAIGLHPLALTESSTGYCGVVHLAPGQQVGFAVTPSTGTGVPRIVMTTAALWGSGGTGGLYGLCDISGGTSIGTFPTQCRNTSTTAVDGILVVTPDTAATPVNLSFQGVCLATCAVAPVPPTITSISPATGPNLGTTKAVVRGSHLTLATDLQLLDNGSSVSPFTTVLTQNVSADGTALTVGVLGGLAPGTYDLNVSEEGFQGGVPSSGYLPNAYTVTAATAIAPQLLTPITPTRFLDTRAGLGAPRARVPASGTVRLAIAGVGGVPPTGVGAVVLNLTAISPTGSGFVRVYPDGGTKPGVSNLNFVAGRTVANQVVVGLTNGYLDLDNLSTGSVDLLVDVTGYYLASGGSGLTAVGPTRILDTRSGVGAPRARVGGGASVRLTVAGVGGVPVSGATAVVLSVTAVNTAAGGWLTVYPDGLPKPNASTLNFAAGQTVPNLVTVPVRNGRIDLANGSSGSIDLIADVAGYYAPGGGVFYPQTPVRALDTRDGTGHAGGTVLPGTAAVLNVNDVPFLQTQPPTALVLNVTVTRPTAGGFLTVAPGGQPVPQASNLNFAPGQTTAVLVVVPYGDGTITFFNGSPGTVDVVADLEGVVDAPTP